MVWVIVCEWGMIMIRFLRVMLDSGDIGPGFMKTVEVELRSEIIVPEVLGKV